MSFRCGYGLGYCYSAPLFLSRFPIVMKIVSQLIHIATDPGIQIYDITPQVQACLTTTAIQQGQAIAFSRHTTVALAINEYEIRLITDIKTYLNQLAPESGLAIGETHYHYLHNDLHLRPNIPPDEPMNAHSHLMAITLNTSETIPIIDGQLALGTYQSLLLFELDGPRDRTILVQLMGQ